MRKNSTLRHVQSRGDSSFARVLTILALLCLTVTSAFAQGTVTLKEDTEDADKWEIKSGETTVTPGVTKVDEGATVTVTYTGSKKVKSVKAVKKAVPLTLEALTDGNIEVYIMNIGGTRGGVHPGSSKGGPRGRGSSNIYRKYSVNNGEKTLITPGITTIEVNAGDKVQFYGNGIYGDDIFVAILGTAQTKVYGNIMSMIDETGYATLTTLLNQPGAFMATFYMNTNLIDASGLLLPATTLSHGCYYGMFMGCTSLTAAPVLPATELAEDCYYEMFYGCESLTTAPTLPATTLAEACYYEMFKGCTSLTTAPTLPATTLAGSCYYEMFKGCTSLNSVTCLATDISASDCTKEWLDGVATTGTFTKASGATWPTGNNGIPDGWTTDENAPNN